MANILIVDDEKNIRSGLQIAFEDEGYDTFEAADGQEAWKVINKNLFPSLSLRGTVR